MKPTAFLPKGTSPPPHTTMPTLYDVAHLIAWNGYAKDMIPYVGVDKAAWNNDEFWFPYGVNQVFGEDKQSRIHRICRNMGIYKYDLSIKEHWYTPLSRINTYNPAERIKQLLSYGANPDIKDSHGFTPLHICSRNGWKRHAEIINILIKAGADINSRNIFGMTPLYMAARNNNVDIVKLLISNGAIHIACTDSNYPIDAAAEGGHLEIVKLLIENGAVVTDNTFYKAIDKDCLPVLKYLGTIRPAPADSISYALWENKTRPIATLAKIGGDLNFIEDGRTLIERVIFDTGRALHELCKAGADVNLTAIPNAMPPIFLAIMTTHLPAIKSLCKYGANMNILYDVRLVGLVTPILYILDKHTYTRPENPVIYDIFMELLPLSDLTLADSGDTPLEFAKKNKMTKYALAIGREALKRKTQK